MFTSSNLLVYKVHVIIKNGKSDNLTFFLLLQIDYFGMCTGCMPCEFIDV